MTKAEKTKFLKEQLAIIKYFKAGVNSALKLTLNSSEFKINEYLNNLYDAKSTLPYLLDDMIRQTEKFTNENRKGSAKYPNLSARGWHKDHNNYNKAESWELPPSLRRTPARNVTKTGAKRKRATTITKYKR